VTQIIQHLSIIVTSSYKLRHIIFPNLKFCSLATPRRPFKGKRRSFLFHPENLANFISQYQHDDEVVHRLALLSCPQSKEWSEIDLEVDKFLSRVLIRFTIKIKAKKKIAF